MAINKDFQLAGIAGAGTSGAELAWFGQGATAPTDATTALVTTTASAVQTLTGTATGGTFVLSYNGVSTAALAYNIATTALATALTGLSTIGTGNVTVAGTAGTSYVVTFAGSLANQSVSTLVVNAGALTGGTLTNAVTTPGSSGWLSAGLIDETGFDKAVKETSKDIRSFGVATATRRIVTASDVTLKLVMQESNKTSLAVYNRLQLGSIVPVGGAFTIADGGFTSVKYQLTIEAVDGLGKARMYFPSVEVTDRDGLAVKAGEIISYGVSLTAYPDSSGKSSYTYYVVPGLT